MSKRIRSWMKEAENLERIEIKRYLKLDQDDDWELHIFCDASRSGYGAVAYIRLNNEKRDVEVIFASAKSKTTPVKSIAIPRLELLAACVGVKLKKKLVPALNGEKQRIIFWTDSRNVLHWIKNCGKYYKTFVANRIAYIQEFS